MRWTIAELKTRGLAAFKANYWLCVAVALIAAFASGSCNFTYRTSHSGSSSSSAPAASVSPAGEAPASGTAVDTPAPEDDTGLLALRNVFREVLNDHPRLYLGLLALAVLAILFVVAAVLLFRFLLLNPLDVGCRNFFLRNATSQASFNEVGFAFRDWKRIVKTMFLRDLFLFLWALFLAIVGGVGVAACSSFLPTSESEPLHGGPRDISFFVILAVVAGILSIPYCIRWYSYRLVPYLLADDPALAGRAAIARSRELMRGQKWHAFLLDLSFIGWYLLSILTCGILLIFRVLPWVCATDAELYRAIAPRPSALPPPLPPAP